MRSIEATVQERLATTQAASKAKLDAGRVDTVFKVGDRVLLRTKELLDAGDIGKLRPRWDGPFTVSACPSPNAYTLALPRKMCCSATVNVDRLKPFFERSDEPPPPGPVSDAGQAGEQEVESDLLQRSAAQPPGGAGGYRVPCPLAGPRLAGRYLAAGGGAGQLPRPGGGVRCHRAQPPRGPLCPLPRRPSGAGAGAGTRARSLISGPSGGWCAPAARYRAGTSGRLAGGWRRQGSVRPGAGGRPVLLYWPDEGRVRGRAVRVSRAAGSSHVVHYGPQSPLGALAVVSLLDAASRGPAGRWVLLLSGR